ncbi:PRC-barrel domain-containing protein [Aureimonas sp. SK2]|uniref:PRC-barrel domain-containing protein n=1 Tax=Aureimonas sp. SK2 TaxID=3015992 RepID=UPI0024449E53|nr:PRC-barrel domain-containing protein [Aureimonas sp. SK2]
MHTLIATLLLTAATGGVAYAQTTPAPATTETRATTTAPTTEARPSSDMSASGGMMQSQGGFYTYQEGNQMLGSGLMGARVMGANDADIGEVDDLLLDRNGQVMAVVVGVGGFLGIGEKDVAIANDQLEFVLAQDAAANNGAAATDTTATPGAATTSPATGATPATGTAMAPAAGTTAAGTAAGTATSPGMMTTPANGRANGMMGYGWGWNGAGIDHIRVNFTREQLEGAPEFEYVR